VRFLGEFAATEAAMRKLVAKLAAKYNRLTFCYEAGPTGYGLYRLIKGLSHECLVAAPSLIPKKPEELLQGMRQESERIERLEQAIREAVPEWSLAEIVTALQAMRGIDLIAAVGVLAEIGDLSRFQNPRELMGYLGLVPSESSTGDSVKRGGITKAGNGRARRILIEAAWAYRHPARVGREKQPKVAAAPRRVREIAWKAQTRLCGRFHTLLRKGKKPTVAATAIARELAAFVWAINREVMQFRTA
jgi:transposase